MGGLPLVGRSGCGVGASCPSCRLDNRRGWQSVDRYMSKDGEGCIPPLTELPGLIGQGGMEMLTFSFLLPLRSSVPVGRF